MPEPEASPRPAPPGPETENLSPGAERAVSLQRAFFFRLAAREFAVASAWCGEIFPLKGLTRVPLAPPSLTGIVALRGGLVPVLDLARLIGLEQGAAGPVRMAVGVRDPRFAAALGFEEGIGFEPFTGTDEAGASAGVAAALGRVTRDGSAKAFLLNVPALFDRVIHELRRSSLVIGLAPGTEAAGSERARARGGP